MKLHILRILSNIEGDGLSAVSLRNELELHLRKRPGELELKTTLSEMVGQSWLFTEQDAFTGDTLYKLTPEGTLAARP